MTKMKLWVVVVLLLCGTFCSCGFKSRQADYLLDSADRYLTKNEADSALLALNTIDGAPLSDWQFSRFVMLRVRSKAKLGMEIEKDSIIFWAKDYLINKKDYENAVFACIYAARVLECRNDIQKAIENYRIAYTLAEKAKNDPVKGDILYNESRLLYQQGLHQESLNCLKNAQKQYDAVEKYSDPDVLELTALNYLCLQKLDSSLLYFESVSKIAKQNNDTKTVVRNLQNESVALCNVMEYNAAKKACLKAMPLINKEDSVRMGRLYFTLGRINNGLGYSDSALFYLYKSEEMFYKSECTIDFIDLYKLLASVELKNGRCEKALYFKQLSFDIQQSADNRAFEMCKSNQDDTFQLIKEERDQYATQRLILFCVVITLSLFLVIILLVLFFKAFKETAKKKFSQLRAEKEQMKRKFYEELSVLRNICENEHLRFICQISNTIALDTVLNTKGSSSNYDKIRGQVREMLKSVNFEDIYQKENDLYEGMLDLLKAEPGIVALNEQDFIIFILSCIGFGKYDIAFIINKSDSTVRSRQWNIRKALGIEPGGHFQDYFQDYLKTHRQ